MGNTLRGGTSLYGKLLVLNSSRIVVRDTLRNREVYECDITPELSALLVGRVGDEIGLRVMAEWRISDMAMVSIEVEEVLPYRRVPLSEALASLRDAVGDAYDNIEDIDAYIRGLRGEDDDDDEE